eukprot:scaffold16512_cov44-Prasinocladus_malaysianus.AAC.1
MKAQTFIESLSGVSRVLAIAIIPLAVLFRASMRFQGGRATRTATRTSVYHRASDDRAKS